MKWINSLYGLNPDDFDLSPEDFDHPSTIHGIGHVYRVMYHCLRFGQLLGNAPEARLAFFAAFLHDLSRQHDGRCSEHGKWAASDKFPLYKKLFIRLGVTTTDLDRIKTAVHYHSLPAELASDHAAWSVTAILKDADALDRIRLGENNLDTRFLRFEQTKNRIGFARALYFDSYLKPVSRFSEMILIAENLESGFRS